FSGNSVTLCPKSLLYNDLVALPHKVTPVTPVTPHPTLTKLTKLTKITNRETSDAESLEIGTTRTARTVRPRGRPPPRPGERGPADRAGGPAGRGRPLAGETPQAASVVEALLGPERAPRSQRMAR